MPTEHVNAFGDPVVSPEDLSRLERVEILRRAARQLQAGEIDSYACAWLGMALQAHLETGRPLEELLGIRPPQGCTRTAAKIAASEQHSGLLLKLSAIVGSDRKAVRVLAGKDACPARARPILAAIAESKGGTSLGAFTRARQGVSRHAR